MNIEELKQLSNNVVQPKKSNLAIAFISLEKLKEVEDLKQNIHNELSRINFNNTKNIHQAFCESLIAVIFDLELVNNNTVGFDAYDEHCQTYQIKSRSCDNIFHSNAFPFTGLNEEFDFFVGVLHTIDYSEIAIIKMTYNELLNLKTTVRNRPVLRWNKKVRTSQDVNTYKYDKKTSKLMVIKYDF